MVRRILIALAMWCALLQAGTAAADGFAALVSPPRFELKARPGAKVRQVIEITNRASTPAKLQVRTADFTLGKDYGVGFRDELAPGSCRPWVALERPVAALPGGATMRYRFEVQVPGDAPAGECRFAILIEGDERAVAQAGALRVPVTGRIGVIVYLIIGEGAPRLEIFGPDVVTLNGQRVPSLRVHNAGDAHGRMGGFLVGTDAKGVKYDFTPSDFPILPGEEREVFLTPSTSSNDHPTLTFPVSVRGTLEWADQKTDLNERFE
jgi:fimbrial chaperone protein